ncbi:MAG: glycosyltransferase family 61 protein [Nocardioides sp.]
MALVSRRPVPRLAERLGATAYDATDPELHVRLTAAGPHSLIVDLGSPGGLTRRFDLLAYHLAPGGRLAMRLPKKARARKRLIRRVRRVRRLQESGAVTPPVFGQDERRPRARHLAALACSLTELRREGRLVLAVNTVKTLARLTEAETDRWLALRQGPDRVLETLPAVRFDSRCELHTAPADVLPAPAAFDVPALSLRQFHHAVCRGRQAVETEDVVLPASFRHHTKKRPPQVRYADWSPRFLRAPDSEPAELGGSYFLIDNYFRGHFGHVLTEVVGLLWGWDRARAHDPDIRPLTFANEKSADLHGWERELLAAYGLTDIEVAPNRATRVERLVTATPMFVQQPSYAHPDITEVYDRIGSTLAARASRQQWPERIFCSRDDGHRACRNGDEVEAWFTDAGFTVVRPEQHPIADQVAMFRAADVIAGYSGSGMFQTAFTGTPRHVITVAPQSYVALNEYLIASVVGHRLDRIYCRPDFARDEDDPSTWRRAFNSNYYCDPDREGAYLREVLDAL